MLDVKWERVPKTVLKDPKAALGFDYSIAVVEGDTVWAEMEWSEEILGIGE